MLMIYVLHLSEQPKIVLVLNIQHSNLNIKYQNSIQHSNFECRIFNIKMNPIFFFNLEYQISNKTQHSHFKCRIPNSIQKSLFKISGIKLNPTINILNVGFNLIFDNHHLKFYCWIEFDIQYSILKKKLNVGLSFMFDIRHSKFEC